MINLNDLTFDSIIRRVQDGDPEIQIGLVKDITLKNGTSAQIQIAAKHHYQTADKKSATVAFHFITAPIDDRAINNEWTNKGGWEVCDMREYLNGEFLSLLPDDLLNVIVPVEIQTAGGGSSSAKIKTTVDKVFLNSEIEVFGKTIYSKGGEGSQLEIFKNWRNRIKSYYGEEWGIWYWLRSPYSGTSAYFCGVIYGGSAYTNYANYSSGVCPCFNIGVSE